MGWTGYPVFGHHWISRSSLFKTGFPISGHPRISGLSKPDYPVSG